MEPHLSPAVPSWPVCLSPPATRLGLEPRCSISNLAASAPGRERGCHARLRGEGRPGPSSDSQSPEFPAAFLPHASTHAETRFPVAWACVGRINSGTEIHSLALISNRLASLVTRPSPIHRIRIVTRKRPEAGCVPWCRGCPPCPAPGCSGATASPVYAPSPLGTASSGRRRRCHLPNTHLRPSLPLLP